ncbi:MAG TPA: dethiobiotin synthase [Casimicrobiaceae bacterium]
MSAVFVTGTDTGIGKTWIAAALLRSLCAAGFRAVGMKPVAAGFAPGTSVNADVSELCAAGNVDAPPDLRNPYSFAEPAAPHLIAATAGVNIDIARIADAYARLRSCTDTVVVEGAGGALVPIDRAHDMLDIAAALSVPVLLVVGMRLGCLNHALLTALAVQRRGLALAGWVANALPPRMALLEHNVDTLTERLGLAPIAIVGPGEHPAFDAARLAMLGFAR